MHSKNLLREKFRSCNFSHIKMLTNLLLKCCTVHIILFVEIYFLLKPKKGKLIPASPNYKII